MSIVTVVVLIALSVLITFQITYIKVDNKYQKALSELKDSQLMYDKLTTIDDAYRNQYVGQIDDNALVDAILGGFVRGTGDRYGEYYTEEEFNILVMDTNSELVGIGVKVNYEPESETMTIVNVIPDSPALEAGILPGDVIEYVGGLSSRELGYAGMLSGIRGEEKTFADITVLRDGKLIDLSIERMKITDYSVFSNVYSNDSTVGIITITAFENGTPQQLKAAINELQEAGVDKLIFDVRNNPGGDLESCEEVLDYLLPEGPIIKLYDNSGKEEVLVSDASEVLLPMMVLTNANTMGVAELFSGVLTDYDKALSVGEKTYGRGLMQSVLSLYDGTAFKVSTHIYTPPYSESFDGIGIEPDISVALPAELKNSVLYRLAQEEDTQLKAAVEAFENA